MLSETCQYINKNRLIDNEERIFVALSGGVDSMVLSELLRRGGYDITLGHCNFHLRGEESDGDEAFVRNYAEKTGLKLFVKHFDTIQYAENQGVSIEMAARELRYSWFEEMVREHGFNKVALAHHGDDQIETFIINLLRSSGINGLKGMRAKNGVYIRPLLWSNRSQIVNYANDNNISWREDHTNQETIYLRNKIRHILLPDFDQIKPNVRQSICNSINYLSAENILYRKLIHEKIISLEKRENDLYIIEKEAFTNDESGKQLLFEWIRDFGFSYDQCEMIIGVMDSESGRCFYSNDYQLVVEKYTIEIMKIVSEEENTPIIIYAHHPENVKDYSCKSEASNLINLSFSSFDRTSDFQINRNSSNTAQFDADKIKLPLKLRHPRQGDRFNPLGLKGSKLLSDFFNDLGFTMFRKRNIWLLTDSDDNILWVIGYRIDDRFKISKNSSSIFQCILHY